MLTMLSWSFLSDYFAPNADVYKWRVSSQGQLMGFLAGIELANLISLALRDFKEYGESKQRAIIPLTSKYNRSHIEAFQLAVLVL